MTAVAGLRAVRELLAAPERWTQHSAARDATGVPVPPEMPTAACWCLVGAACKCEVLPEILPYLGAALAPRWGRTRLMDRNIVTWQDHASHPEVLALLDRAIVLAEGGEGA